MHTHWPENLVRGQTDKRRQVDIGPVPYKYLVQAPNNSLDHLHLVEADWRHNWVDNQVGPLASRMPDPLDQQQTAALRRQSHPTTPMHIATEVSKLVS